jgi:ECF sigma factor
LRTSHGDDVLDFEEHFHRFLRHTSERQARVIRLVAHAGSTAWEIARKLFPSVKDIHRFLAVSEAIAHLDQAVAENKIQMETREDVDYWMAL